MITNNRGLPLSLAVWLAHDNYDAYEGKEMYLSATSFLKPTRELVLVIQDDGETINSTDVYDLIASRMGTAIHDSIERAWVDAGHKNLEKLGFKKSIIDRVVINPDPSKVTEKQIPVYLEQRRIVDFEGIKVGGKMDFLAEGTLEDFKSTGTYNWIKGSNKDKYILQGSIYRWLMPDIVTSDYIKIQYIFTDWSKMLSLRDKYYPQMKTIEEKYKLLSIEETATFIRGKINEVKSLLKTEQKALPLCTQEELWQQPTQYKYYKNPQKMDRSTKNFDSYDEAHQRLLQDNNVGKIVEVPGQVKRCAYCKAILICDQAKDLIQRDLLVI